MRINKLIGLWLVFVMCINDNAIAQQREKVVHIAWSKLEGEGSVEISSGHVKRLVFSEGKGEINGSRFESRPASNVRLTVTFADIVDHVGPESSVVTVRTNTASFSFLLRDVHENFPIYLPVYQVTIVAEKDSRNYHEVESDILSRGLSTKLQKIEVAPEVSFASATGVVRNMSAPTWLGVSRDFRLFEITESLPDMPRGEANVIAPKLAASGLSLPETDNETTSYLYTIGRGIGVNDNITRRLEGGVLPILHATQVDDDVVYHSVSFASPERSPLTRQGLKGTDFLVADRHSNGHMMTDRQKDQLKHRLNEALNPSEEIVLYHRTSATNNGSVPRYAWFKAPRPGTRWFQKYKYSFDTNTGLSTFASGRVFCISRLNGKPLANEEIAVLLQPGETASFEFCLPHSPVSAKRAMALSTQSFEQRYEESKAFWLAKLDDAATIRLPEKRIEEMVQAGLLHLDLITYGKEPDGTLAPTIGVYSPIGTESAPIIQFYASVGLRDVARRSLTFFLDKQHEDGLIQNFGGYMVETGAALWTMGEYFRYTRDTAWVSQVVPQLLKSCDYLIRWRNRNKKEELRGRGYGMIDGKVADPEDHFHQFMLNGYAVLGMSRVAEMLTAIGRAEAGRIGEETEAWKEDIRKSFFNAMERSPVVPLGNGAWSPTAPPWTEAAGPRLLFLDKEVFWSHGTFTVSDGMLGPLYLVFCEVLDTHEIAAKMLLDYHSELLYQGNAAFSQPYYSRHNWMQAKLGMVKPFLNTYYHTVAAHADRETYTFWEHMYRVSPHKTHEEAWFLMETRWMLYMEDGNALDIFKTIPRAWMADGEEILLDGVWSYFGPLRVEAKSNVSKGYIEATVESTGDRKPDTVRIRLPHPDYRKPTQVIGGTYDEKTESIIVTNFDGKATVRLAY